MFLKHLNLDYSCLREAVIELVVGYNQMAYDIKIELEAPLLDNFPSTPLDAETASTFEKVDVVI